ncbi:hypothetical protein ACRYCC_41995 [Actinomadura scrupuli]|uniref:hypothetical protein n=1 Tax=Actinomadura scrupuli TaxID=559629 RepID=UPI003D985982
MADRTIQTSSGPPGSGAAVFTGDFEGDFEAHVTVRCAEREHDALDRWAASRGLKFSHIVLDRGRVVSQPMLTLRGTATLDLAGAAARELAAALGTAGYDVARTKIEMTPWSAGVPATDGEAAVLGAGFYFEHHIKLALTPGTETGTLAALAARHGAHVSRNARRIRQDGVQERFVTQRCRMAGTATAQRRLRELTAALLGRHHTIVGVEQEFVVFDSDASLDHGWIDEHAAGAV